MDFNHIEIMFINLLILRISLKDVFVVVNLATLRPTVGLTRTPLILDIVGKEDTNNLRYLTIMDPDTKGDQNGIDLKSCAGTAELIEERSLVLRLRLFQAHDRSEGDPFRV